MPFSDNVCPLQSFQFADQLAEFAVCRFAEFANSVGRFAVSVGRSSSWADWLLAKWPIVQLVHCSVGRSASPASQPSPVQPASPVQRVQRVQPAQPAEPSHLARVEHLVEHLAESSVGMSRVMKASPLVSWEDFDCPVLASQVVSWELRVFFMAFLMTFSFILCSATRRQLRQQVTDIHNKPID